MKLHLFEATNGGNWGKFAVGRFEEDEYAWRSRVDTRPLVLSDGDDTFEIDRSGVPLLNAIGWNRKTVWVLDLQTREGAVFFPGGFARADLQKHRIWVCPLYEPFLEWLYQQDLTDLGALPSLVELPDAPLHIWGYRRLGRGGNIEILPGHDEQGRDTIRIEGWFGHGVTSRAEGQTVAEALRNLADKLAEQEAGDPQPSLTTDTSAC